MKFTCSGSKRQFEGKAFRRLDADSKVICAVASAPRLCVCVCVCRTKEKHRNEIFISLRRARARARTHTHKPYAKIVIYRIKKNKGVQCRRVNVKLCDRISSADVTPKCIIISKRSEIVQSFRDISPSLSTDLFTPFPSCARLRDGIFGIKRAA